MDKYRLAGTASIKLSLKEASAQLYCVELLCGAASAGCHGWPLHTGCSSEHKGHHPGGQAVLHPSQHG